MQLTNQLMNQFRRQLEEEMNDIRARLDEDDSFQTNLAMRDSTQELSMYDNHPGDLGSEMFEREKDLGIRDGYSIRLMEIDDALERMEDGSYGVCANCGTDIPIQRLEARPAAKFCVGCQEVMDEREVSGNRPVEENFLFPGFGRTFMDENDEDQNGFDGEDSWQSVAQYGTAATSDENPDAMDEEDFYTEADERTGYVQDVEGFILADIYGNPVEGTPFVRNNAYQRAWEDTYADELQHVPRPNLDAQETHNDWEPNR